MEFGKKHSNVVSMLREDLPKDPALAQEIDRKIQESVLSNTLAALRNSRSMSQGEVARHFQCGQAKISKIESSMDDSLSFQDIRLYAEATGYDLEIVFRKRGATLIDHIKYHVGRIRGYFDQMAELSRKDAEIAVGVRNFCMEALVNLVKLVSDTTHKLPKAKKTSRQPVTINVEDGIPNPDSASPPRKINREPCST